jgi:glycosyltransferase involved in cell wall biosynthesis
MRVVMTLLVRDEADVIGALLGFHFAIGVDFVIATDNGSTDGTTDILEAHERDGRLHLIREPSDVSQEQQVTRMARLAATDFGADWVINSDADEFWFPGKGTLEDLLAAMPLRVGRVRCSWSHFPPRPGDGFFAERMTARLCVPQPPRFHHQIKLVHRADPTVVVAGGNHNASGKKLRRITKDSPVDVLHFPLRSRAQFERKFLRWFEILPSLPARYQEVYDAHREGRLDELWERYVLSDEELERGLRAGTYAVDTRLADTLRQLHAAPIAR